MFIFAQKLNFLTMIKKLLFVSCMLSMGFSPIAQAQTPQIHNIGFENWTDLGGSSEEPTSWNSFMTADGTWSIFAAQQVKRSTMKRPGSAGTYSAVIWCRNASGTMANGNLTTGRIKMGSTTPSSTSNYNRTVVSDTLFNETFNGLPDSLVVWVRTKNSNTAHEPRIHAIIHDSYDVRDPIDAGSTSHVVAEAVLNWTPVNNVWVRKSIPFTAGAASTPVYVLISMTTCKDPGVGTAGDSLYIDDLQFIYNPPIATITNTPACGTGSVTVSSSKSGTQTYDLCDNGGAVLQTWTGSATSHTFSGLANGTYRGKVTLGTLVSLLSSPTVLTNNVIPVATVSNTPSCGNGSITVSSDQSGTQTFELCNTGGSMLYTWTGNATSHVFSPVAGGVYTGRVTLGSCISILSGTTTLVVDIEPNATISSTAGCGSGTVTVTSDQSGNQTFNLCNAVGTVLQSWSGTGSSHIFINIADGTYTGSLISASCTSDISAPTTLTNTQVPVATVANTPDCGQGTVTVFSDQTALQTFDLCDGTGVVLDTWTGNALSHDFQFLPNGTYKGKVTLLTCESALSSATVLVNNIVPIATISITPGCASGSVTIFSDQSGNQVYELFDGIGNMLQTWTGNVTSHTFTGLSDGDYKGRMTLTGCTANFSSTLTLTNDIMPLASVSSVSGCGSGSVTVTSDQSGLQTFNLCDGTGNILSFWTGTVNSHTFTNQANGTYTGKVESGSCTSVLSTTTTLSNTPGPTATIAVNPACDLGEVTVTSDQNTTQTFDLCNSAGAVLQTWTGNAISYTFTGLVDGTYKGKVTVAGCESPFSSTELLTNTITPLLIDQPADTIVCQGSNAAFSFTDDGNATSYQWMVKTGGIWTSIISAGTNPVYSGWDSQTLTLTGVIMANSGFLYRCNLSNGACSSLSDSAELNVNLCTGIADNNSENIFSVGPVPFNNTLNITTPNTEKVVMQIFSIEGKLASQTELYGKTSYRINTESLSNGTFIVKLTSDKEMATFRVVKND
jgi:hypothetical protein